MNINHENIDKWLFDYVEGNLNSSQKRELNSFLNSHPEYKADLDSWKNSHVDEDSPVFQNTAALNAIAGKSFARKAIPFALLLLIASSVSYYYFTGYDPAESIASVTPDETLQPLVYSPEKNSESRSSDAGLSQLQPENGSVQVSPVAFAVNESPSNTSGLSSRGMNKKGNSIPEPHVNRTDNTGTTHSAITKEKNVPEIKNSTGLIPEEKKEIPVLKIKGLFAQKPEINISLYARKAALAKTEVKDSSVASNTGSSINSNSGEKKQERIQTGRKKRFSDAILGIYNTRDHILLHPASLNAVQYAGFTGSSVSPGLSMNYRNQYTSSGFASSTGTFVYHQYSRKIRSGWGIGGSMTDYGQGDYSIRSGHFYYSPKIKINKNFTVEPGITAIYTEHTAGITAINKHEAMEPVRGITGHSIPSGFVSINRKRNSFDFSLSTLVNTKYFYAAVAVDHIMGTQLALYNEGGSPIENRLVYKAVAGTDYKRIHESKWKISPQISFLRQGELTELWAGSLLTYDIFHFGLSGSVNKQVLGAAGITAGPFRIGYQFDRGASYLDDNNYNSHEVSLRVALTGLQRRPSTILDNY